MQAIKDNGEMEGAARQDLCEQGCAQSSAETRGVMVGAVAAGVKWREVHTMATAPFVKHTSITLVIVQK